MNYSSTDCFETFAFPKGWEVVSALDGVGREYYEFRMQLLVKNDEGLTKTYNRFHDPEERDLDIVKLRELHDAMDRAVLDAYGWTDIQPRCEFILDYEDEEDDNPGRPNRKRKPYRYRWPDDTRDEALGRLLELNAERAAAERRSESNVPKSPGRRATGNKPRFCWTDGGLRARARRCV